MEIENQISRRDQSRLAPLLVESNKIDIEEDDRGFFSHPTILQYWQIAVRWRLLIVGVVASCLIVSVIVTLLMPPLYQSTILIEVSREQKNIANVEGVEAKVDRLDAEFYATQYALLRSETLAERVAKDLRLDNSAAFFEAHGASLEDISDERMTSKSAIADRKLRAAVTLLLKNLKVKPVQRSRLIEVQYTSRSADLSASIANAWAKEFIGATMDRQFASSANARKFLEARLAQLRDRIDDSERGIVRYANANGIVTLDTVRDADGKTYSGRTLASADLEALNEALTRAKAERIIAQSRLSKVSAEISVEALGSQVISQLRAERAEIDAEYAKMLVQFAPAYPPALALKSQRDALDSAISREIARIASSRNLAYNEATVRERELQQKVAALIRDLSRQREAAIQQTIFQRDVDTNRQLYDALLQRYKEIGVAGSIGTSNIAVVDPAKVPSKPSSPILFINIIVGILAGLSLSGLVVFALEQIDEGIRNPEDVKALLNAPLLGNIPSVDISPVQALSDSKSSISEAYFSARSTLAFSTNSGIPKSFAVTSTQPGEGKSTTSYSLAVIIAKTGKRVLLIDGDLRSPSIHSFLGLSNSSGLSNLLAGEDIGTAIHQDVEKGVSVITTGPIPPSPPELLSSDRFSELLEAFGGIYDHIIVDLPPVLGLADSILMGRSVQGVVYVVQAEKTPRRAIRASLQRLRNGGVHVLGVIVTQVDYTKHNFGYGYGYGYGYAYGYGAKEDSDAEP